MSCGQGICSECRVRVAGKNYCKNCAAKLTAQPGPQQQAAHVFVQPPPQPAQVFVQASPQPQKTPYAQRKSSGVAIVLSFFWMGLGQLYNGQIGKGILLMILEPILFILGFLTLIFLIGFFILFLGFVLWVWNLYDAYNTAERINRGELVRDFERW